MTNKEWKDIQNKKILTTVRHQFPKKEDSIITWKYDIITFDDNTSILRGLYT